VATGGGTQSAIGQVDPSGATSLVSHNGYCFFEGHHPRLIGWFLDRGSTEGSEQGDIVHLTEAPDGGCRLTPGPTSSGK